MNQKDNELYKAGQFTEWQKSVEEEIRNLNKKLDIVLFLSVWNDFEKVLNNNAELKDCELIISGALKENSYEEEYLHTIVEITQNNPTDIDKIENKIADLLLTNDYNENYNFKVDENLEIN